MNYHNKSFKLVSTSSSGEASADTIFNYFQHNTLLVGDYSGGDVKNGHIVGTVHEDGSLTFYYNHVNANGEFRIGKCMSKPEVMENGKIRLHESWSWTFGGEEEGESILEEM